MADLMQQARELLAAEFAKDWQRGNCKMIAESILNGDELRGYGIPYALDAIAAALRAAPEVTPEMVAAAEEAYMPFGDMELALNCALAASPQEASDA